MKYQKQIDNIKTGKKTRGYLGKLRKNAEIKLEQGDLDAKIVIDEIDKAVPTDQYILFMGFCPDGDASNRLDSDWKEKGICRFDWEESEGQMEDFYSICAGDLVILKKIELFGITMKLYGYGRVKSVAYDDNNMRYLVMDWHDQSEVIEVPLMACNSTVNIRAIEQVEEVMPEDFWQWLGEA